MHAPMFGNLHDNPTWDLEGFFSQLVCMVQQSQYAVKANIVFSRLHLTFQIEALFKFRSSGGFGYRLTKFVLFSAS